MTEASRPSADDPSQLIRLIDRLDTGGDQTLVQAWGRDAPAEFSYAWTARSVQRLARALHVRLHPGEPVALFAPESADWIVAALAVVRAGGVVAPMDIQMSPDTLADLLDEAGASWVVTGRRHATTVRDAAPDAGLVILDVDADDYDGPGRPWQTLENDAADPLPSPTAGDPAVLFFTSGTTGPPKGVPLTHGNIGYQLETLKAAGIVRSTDRVLLPLPLHHVYPFVMGMLTPIHLGLTVVLPHALTGDSLIRALRGGRASVIVGVPKLYRALYDGLEARIAAAPAPLRLLLRGLVGACLWSRRRGINPGRRLLAPLRRRLGPRLRVLASGGSPLDEDLALRLEALGWQVAIGYGLTETSPLLTINPPGRGPVGSVGRVAPGTHLRCDEEAVADGDDGEGEIQARGPGVFDGYLGDADKTREAFTDDGWYRTGDLGYRDDAGYWYVTGRLSTLLVTESGENVQPDAVEERYANHPSIREIGVLMRDGRLVGLAVPADEDASVRDAAREVAEALPSYQRLANCEVSRRPLARTRIGKIRRHRLEERYDAARQGEDEERDAEPQHIEDMNADERALLEDPAARSAWRSLARRYPRAGLTLDSDLRLDLGIDSMDWVELTLDVSERAGTNVDERVIDQVSSVRELLEATAESSRDEAEGDSPLEDPHRAISSAQARWLEPPGAGMRMAARLLHTVDRLLARSLFRLRVRGLDNLPSGGYVLVCNHVSNLDPFAIAAALPYRQLRGLYWGGWTGMAFRGPVSRFVSRAARVVPVDPERGALSSLALAGAVLDDGYGLVWFPEGGRASDGRLQPLRPGIGLLLAHFPRPVIVARVQGTYEAMPVGRRLPRLHPVEIDIADVVDTETLVEAGDGEDDAERIVAALEQRMRQMAA
jgi:long-chain acyl-CoA synthetase